MDNTSKFDGLADVYDASRPNYPVEAVRAILVRINENAVPRVCLDVGAGTGISTRALARVLQDWQLIAIEPNIDMARKARIELSGQPNAVVEQGTAEKLPSTDTSCGLVTVAQALHWFDRPTFFSEARRVLVGCGTLAILNNNRQTEDSPALLAMEDFFEAENPSYSRHYRTFDIFSELSCATGFTDVERFVHTWMRTVTRESLADYFLSRSSATPIVRRLGHAETRSRIIDTIAANSGSEPFEIAIECEVTTAQAV